MKWLLASLFIVSALLLPATASADDGNEDDGLTLRVTGDLYIRRHRLPADVVIDGNATVDGTITNRSTVINGTAIVNGTVRTKSSVVSGTLDLRSGASLKASPLDSDLIRADGVTVTGAIEQRDGVEIPAGVLAALTVYFWVAMTFAVVVPASPLWRSAAVSLTVLLTRVATGEPSNALIGTIAFWVIVPMSRSSPIVTWSASRWVWACCSLSCPPSGSWLIVAGQPIGKLHNPAP